MGVYTSTHAIKKARIRHSPYNQRRSKGGIKASKSLDQSFDILVWPPGSDRQNEALR
jgi:hypothetical protein